ncbi:zinc-finger domain-containing protein [Pseudoalteromonas sp. S558]|uniref:zinc-finger domain-containing protein n=1 Tax=Pseudoalteromonas sp. S558 TaxID=2066515 RepID=UPI0033913D58
MLQRISGYPLQNVPKLLHHYCPHCFVQAVHRQGEAVRQHRHCHSQRHERVHYQLR